MILKQLVEIQNFIGLQPIINSSYNVKNNFYEIFTICQAQIDPKNQKCSEFIEIWYIQYFKHADLNFGTKNDFY